MTFVRHLIMKKGSTASTTPLYYLIHDHSVRCTLPKCELSVQKLMSAPRVFSQLCENECNGLLSLLLNAICPGDEDGAYRPLKGKANIAALSARLLVVHRHVDSIAGRLALPPTFCERPDVQQLLVRWAFSPAHDPRTSAAQLAASGPLKPADIAVQYATDMELMCSIVDLGVADRGSPVEQIVDAFRKPSSAQPDTVRLSSSAEAPERQIGSISTEEPREEHTQGKVRSEICQI